MPVRSVAWAAAERFGWPRFEKANGRGRGFAFARYKNRGAYAAVPLEVAVDRESGRIDVLRAVCAVDSGDAVNPDGIRNQMISVQAHPSSAPAKRLRDRPPPALANAVADATGARFRDLPLTRQRVAAAFAA